jgi:hypothetical protein
MLATIWQHLPRDIGVALPSERGNPWPPFKNAAVRGAASVHELETPSGANTSYRTALRRGGRHGFYLSYKVPKQRRLIILPPDQINRYWEVQVDNWHQCGVALPASHGSIGE